MLCKNFAERLTCSLLSQHTKYKLPLVSIIFACYFCLFIKHIIFSGYSNFQFLIYNAFFYLHCKRNVFLKFSMLKLDFSFFLSIFQICWTILLHTYWSRLINSRWFLFPMCFGHVLVYIVLYLFLVQLCLNVPIYHLNKNKDVKPFSIIKKTYLSAKTLDANEQYRRNSCWNILAKLYRS